MTEQPTPRPTAEQLAEIRARLHREATNGWPRVAPVVEFHTFCKADIAALLAECEALNTRVYELEGELKSYRRAEKMRSEREDFRAKQAHGAFEVFVSKPRRIITGDDGQWEE